MKRHHPIAFAAGALLVLVVRGQEAAATPDVLTLERVRSTVEWLAADARQGRDSGSDGLEETADWIAQRFQAAGLKPVREGQWFHDFALPALKLDAGAVELQLRCSVGDAETAVPLVADADVRWWRAADGVSGDEECTVVRAEDPALPQLLMASSGRRPILIEVDESSPFWASAAGLHTVLEPRRQAARPIFLVRRGVLPETPANKPPVWRLRWQVPVPERLEVVQHNVAAVLRGREGGREREQHVVVSAHYDHVGVGVPVDGDSIYNGADDDASGTTAVLLLAEALAREPAPRRSILFVCFAGEERGLRGSRAFCATPPLPLEQIVCNLNIEMIGRPEPGNEGKAWFTGVELSDFAAVCAAAMATAGVATIEFPMASRLFSQSDNLSFARHGIVAHSVSAGSLHADYHQPGDEVQKLDLEHMTRIVKALAAATRDLADRPKLPEWNDEGRAVVERLGRRR